MPLIDFIRTQYHWTYDEPSNSIGFRNGKYHRTMIYNGMIPFNSFFKQITIKKSKVNFNCRCCNKARAKGTRYVGDNWTRICQFCMDEWITNSKKSFDKMKKAMTEQQNILKQNKEDWEKEAIVSELK